MSEYRATVEWECGNGEEFLKGRYSREHRWSFDGGISLPASAAPTSVPAPWSSPDAVDPEEAYVASISSCHMLTFLFIAYCHGIRVDRYRDEAVGVMTPNERGQLWVSEVTLRPRITYGGEQRPTAEEEENLHHLAHEECYIANSIRTRVEVRAPAPVMASTPTSAQPAR